MPTPADLLSAVVTYLKATSSVTSLLSAPDAIFTDNSNFGTNTSYLLVEGYNEILPGETTEDEPVDLRVCVYAQTLDAVTVLLGAVKVALDSPNLNSASTRAPFAWTGGSETGCMRNHTHKSRQPMMNRAGVLLYDGRIDYQFWVTPNQ